MRPSLPNLDDTIEDYENAWSALGENGPAKGARFKLPLGVPMTAGRAPDAGLPLPADDAEASRYHAVLEASPSGVCVSDLQSRNGVFLNDQKITTGFASEGDRVRLGRTTFVLLAERTRMSLEPTVPAAMQAPLWGMSTAKAKPYRCDLCGLIGPVPTIEHESWWSEIGWLCERCAATRRTPREEWPINVPARLGAFEILGFVGQGGMAAVFEARHVDAGIRVALKVLVPQTRLQPQSAQRFVKEQRILASLAHARIVRCVAVGNEAGWLYVAMEFLTAGDADQLPSADTNNILRVGADTFEALAFAHAHDIVHRDVKPSNVLLVREDGFLRGKLSDFGIAKNFRAVGGTFVTRSSEIAGSAAFIAPEQLSGFKRVGPSADVYSAAVSVYYLLTQQLPVALNCKIDEAIEPQLCLATLATERVPIRAYRPDLHANLAGWLDLLVQRDESARSHIDAAQAAAALRAFAP